MEVGWENTYILIVSERFRTASYIAGFAPSILPLNTSPNLSKIFNLVHQLPWTHQGYPGILTKLLDYLYL